LVKIRNADGLASPATPTLVLA